MIDVKKKLKELNEGRVKFFKDMPEVAKNYTALNQAISKEGALTVKTKELLYLVSGIFARCEYCIIGHVRAALSAGCSRQEILEAASIAIAMSGGPGFAYTCALVESALEEYEQN